MEQHKSTKQINEESLGVIAKELGFVLLKIQPVSDIHYRYQILSVNDFNNKLMYDDLDRVEEELKSIKGTGEFEFGKDQQGGDTTFCEQKYN